MIKSFNGLRFLFALMICCGHFIFTTPNAGAMTGMPASKEFTVTVADTVFTSLALEGWSEKRSLSDSGYGYTVHACDQFGNSIPNYPITLDVAGESIKVSKTSVNSRESVSVTTEKVGTSTITKFSSSIFCSLIFWDNSLISS